MIDNIENCFLKESGIDEFVCFHDECYGTYTHLAPAMGIEVPFKPIHLFDFISQRLDKLKTHIKPLNVKVAYQRPCSNRLVPETQGFVDEIFEKIGADRVKREYDYDNALCCAGTVMAQQKLDKCDDLQKRNIDDMVDAGAKFCVFNCPACLNSMKDRVTERGIIPILMSELCQLALGD